MDLSSYSTEELQRELMRRKSESKIESVKEEIPRLVKELDACFCDEGIIRGWWNKECERCCWIRSRLQELGVK